MEKKVWKNSQPPRFILKLYEFHIPSTWAGLKEPHCGLVNVGNTCYLNASLQSLFHIPAFVDFLQRDIEHRKGCRSLLGCIVCTLYRTFISMRTLQVLKPIAIVNLLRRISKNNFEVGMEEDPHEFLTVVHEAIQDDILSRAKWRNVKPDFCAQQTTAMGEIFGGWMKTTDECQSCRGRQHTYNPINHLFVTCKSSIQVGVDMLLTDPEVVTDYSCLNGCKNTSCHRVTNIHSYPRVLKVVLKRYNDLRQRISDPVIVNTRITVGASQYKILSCIFYEQLGCGGHFQCITSCPNGSFTLFNDSQVRENCGGLTSDLIKSGVYIAFYQMQSNMTQPEKRPYVRSPSCKSPFFKKFRAQNNKLIHSPHKSPYEKKVTKSLKFSSRKRKFRKLFHGRVNDLDLAEPLQSGGSTMEIDAGTDSPEKYPAATPIVTFNIRRKMSTSPKCTEPTPPTFSSQDTTVTAVVTPVKLNLQSGPECDLRQGSTVEVAEEDFFPQEITLTESEPGSPSCGSQDTTVTAVVTPVKLNLPSGPECDLRQGSTVEVAEEDFFPQDITLTESEPGSPSCGSQDTTVTAVVTPVKLKFLTGPKCDLRQGSTVEVAEEAFFSQEEPGSPSCGSQDTTVTAVVTPVKLKFLTGPKCDLRQGSTVEVAEEAFFSQEEPGSPSCGSQDTTVTAVVTPVKLNLPSGPKCDLRQGSSAKDAKDVSLLQLECRSNLLDHDSDPPFSLPMSHNGAFNNNEIEDELLIVSQNFIPVVLTSKDVPNADLPLPEVSKNTQKDLRHWLKLRGVPRGRSNKDELVRRVEACQKMNRANFIDPAVDSGVWYNNKRDLMSTQDASRLPNSDLFPENGWDSFPSRDIPTNYNFGSVYYYLVETMPQYQDPSVIYSEHEWNSDTSDDENEETIVLGDELEEEEWFHNEAVLGSKKMRRGIQFLKSCHVKGVVDCLPDRFHYYKAHIRASFEAKAYWVQAAISQISGNILRCECQCVASQLGRCSHISALLLFLLQHKALNGDKAITCTSKPCAWNQGSLKRNPSVAAGRQYNSFKLDVIRRNQFDPRPTAFRQGPSTKVLNDFIRALHRTKETPCAFQGLLKLRYDDFSYNDIDLQIFPYLRRELYEYLRQLNPEGKSGAFELPGTTEQFNCALYRYIRSITCTSSVCHRIAHFRCESAKKNFLKQHMWNMDNKETAGMRYGKKNESVARQKYLEEQMEKDPDITVVPGGSNLNTHYPGLSCSHDGWVTKNGEIIKLLEIKCPFSLQNVDPHNFDSFLKGKKLRSFYLQRTAKGEIKLKEDTIYYDQVQMEMAITGVTACDFVVWSKKGLLTIPMSFNQSAWEVLHTKLEKFHWEYMSLEYFARRTAMELDPFCLP